MTTARRSRSRTGAALALALAALAVAPASAHRRDEYLQAARIGIESRRVQVSLDLTPGIAIADSIVTEIDRDHDRRLTPEETRAYTNRVLSDIQLSLDGRPLALTVVRSQYADVPALLSGEGAIQLQLFATLTPQAAGEHALVFVNRHRIDIGAYLANALVPADQFVSVVDQKRDVNQRELAITYALQTVEAPPMAWPVPAIAGTLVIAAAARSLQLRRERRQR